MLQGCPIDGARVLSGVIIYLLIYPQGYFYTFKVQGTLQRGVNIKKKMAIKSIKGAASKSLFKKNSITNCSNLLQELTTHAVTNTNMSTNQSLQATLRMITSVTKELFSSCRQTQLSVREED